jgi:hypothetical protein
MTIYDPKGEEFDTVLLASSRRTEDYMDGDSKDHQHRSYHRKVKQPGVHRICLKAHKSLFKEVPNVKYEMSLMIDSIFEA